jgi:hypothetical protein
MTLTNADRQRLHRERVKVRLQDDPGEVSRLSGELAALRTAVRALQKPSAELLPLTEQQLQDRADMVADLLSSRAWWRKSRKEPPRFLGWTRDQWTFAPEELLRHFGLQDAVKSGLNLMQRDLHENLESRGRRLKSGARFTKFRGE